MPANCCPNPFARAHSARIFAMWKLLHKKTGECDQQLLLLDHDEESGGLAQVAAIQPGGFFIRAKEDPLAGNLSEIHIAMNAMPDENVTIRVSAFQFGQRQYARKDRHPDVEQPAGTNQFFAFLAEPKEVL